MMTSGDEQGCRLDDFVEDIETLKSLNIPIAEYCLLRLLESSKNSIKEECIFNLTMF